MSNENDLGIGLFVGMFVTGALAMLVIVSFVHATRQEEAERACQQMGFTGGKLDLTQWRIVCDSTVSKPLGAK